ncbi:MAG: ABC transporter permease [Actinobacteria bacterium]|nr:ABC transporter permease [Actinomycetota bacterium]
MLRSAWRSLLHHKLRLVLSGVAIVLGVGFVVGTLIFTDTLNQTFTGLFADTTSDVVIAPSEDVQSSGFAGTVATLPAALLDEVAVVEGVAKAGGQVFADGVAIIDSAGAVLGTTGAPQFGSNWNDDEDLTPYRLTEGRGPTAGGEVALDSVSADKAGYAVGDEVSLVAPQGALTATLVGIFRYGTSGNLAGATIAAFDTATAQQLLLGGKSGYTEIDLVAADGVTQEALAADVGAVVGASATVRTGKEAADQAAADITAGLAFINIFLLVFAGIALFVGTFIILNTFSMLVAQRSRELALLRALGATRGQVLRSLIAESFGVGLVGAVLGLGVGVAVAFGLEGLFRAIGADIPTEGLVLLPRTVIVGLLIGVLVTVVAALAPALRASRIPPMAALRDDIALPARSLRLRAIAGGVLLLGGLAAMAAGASAGGASGSQLVGIGVVAALVGAIVVSPAIAGPLVRVLGFAFPRMFGTIGSLALQNAERQPRRTAATASALMIGLALVTALTIFATSAKSSINQVIDRTIGAEFLISNQTQRPFPEQVALDVATVPGVASVSPVKLLPAQVNGTDAALVGVDPETWTDMASLTFTSGALDGLESGGMAVDAQSAADAGLAMGDMATVLLQTGSADFTVTGIYEPAGAFSGFVVSSAALVPAGVEMGDSFIYAKAVDGADLTTVQADVTAALAAFPTVQVQSQAEFKEQITSGVNQILLVMVMLLSLAILIAILGIVNTLVLSVVERTREIGMLRAVGALRRQIRSMVVLEALVIAVYGAVVGLLLGLWFAVALQRTLVDQGIEVLDVPWLGLVAFLVLAGVVGILAALWPAFRAGRLNVLEAISTE